MGHGSEPWAPATGQTLAVSSLPHTLWITADGPPPRQEWQELKGQKEAARASSTRTVLRAQQKWLISWTRPEVEVEGSLHVGCNPSTLQRLLRKVTARLASWASQLEDTYALITEKKKNSTGALILTLKNNLILMD